MISRGLQNLVTFELVDYRDFAKQHPGEFDRIISCEMVRCVVKHVDENNAMPGVHFSFCML